MRFQCNRLSREWKNTTKAQSEGIEAQMTSQFAKLFAELSKMQNNKDHKDTKRSPAPSPDAAEPNKSAKTSGPVISTGAASCPNPWPTARPSAREVARTDGWRRKLVYSAEAGFCSLSP